MVSLSSTKVLRKFLELDSGGLWIWIEDDAQISEHCPLGNMSLSFNQTILEDYGSGPLGNMSLSFNQTILENLVDLDRG